MRIHPTAVVHPRAELSGDVEVGPHACVGENVTVGPGCRIGAGAQLEGWLVLGPENRVMTGAVLGSEPQDLKFKGECSWVRVGARNVFREYVTVNRGTEVGGSETVIGDDCLLMAYCHVAHDCRVGNHVIMANVATLGGHVTLGDGVVVSGLTAVHHFVTIGELAILGGCSKVVQDIPPFMMADGHPARVYGLNVVGLRRNGIAPERRKALREAFRLLYRSGLSVGSALERIESEVEATPEVRRLVEFMLDSARGEKGRAREAEHVR